MNPTSSFLRLCQQLELAADPARRAEYDAGFFELADRYLTRLIGLARSQLAAVAGLEVRVGADDVAQSVLLLFHKRQQVRPFELTDWAGLWALLAGITYRRVKGKYAEHVKSAKRSLNREARPRTAEGDGTDPWDDVAGREPSAADGAELLEAIEAVTRHLPDADRRAIAIGLVGLPDPEIAAAVGRTQARVRQVREAVIEDCLRQFSAPSDPPEG